MIITYLLYKLLFEPISTLSIDILSKIRDTAFMEMYGIDRIRTEIELNEDAYESGEISRNEYEKRESLLLRRLERAEELEKAIGKDKALYESGRITREEFEARRSDVVDTLEKKWRSKVKKEEEDKNEKNGKRQ